MRPAPEGLKGTSLVNWRLTQLEEDVHDLKESNKSANTRLNAILTTLVVSLILLLLQLVAKYKGT